ncbi:MAG: HAMP domain-containing histidine kinase [Cytophagaceae bacterium]|nr:MAG: HAMP domain-containing histidine kinase [Cytophagaceae bacterium]
MLRQTICETLEEECPLDVSDKDIIIDMVECAVNQAAVEFSHTLRDTQHALIATLTHDFRSPITASLLSIESLMRHNSDAERVHLTAERIARNMHRLDALVQGLLDINQMQSGQHLPMVLEACAVDSLLSEVVERTKISYPGRISLAGTTGATALWDINMVRRILENLIYNGIKYGKFGSPVSVRATKEQQFIKIAVHNEGTPISAGEQEALFDPGYRSQSAVRQQGWGLGLSTVKNFAEAHSGSVHLESNPEVGTIFTVTLPQAAGD